MKKLTGLTLVELLVTLAVISVLLAMLVPHFGTVTTSNKISASANALSTELAYARDEAITRNANVTITAKNNDWKNGWTIADASGNVLRDVGALASGISLTVNPATTTSITYKSDGSQGTGGDVAILFCDSALPSGNTRGTEVRVITSGRQTVNTGQACP